MEELTQRIKGQLDDIPGGGNKLPWRAVEALASLEEQLEALQATNERLRGFLQAKPDDILAEVDGVILYGDGTLVMPEVSSPASEPREN